MRYIPTRYVVVESGTVHSYVDVAVEYGAVDIYWGRCVALENCTEIPSWDVAVVFKSLHRTDAMLPLSVM